MSENLRRYTKAIYGMDHVIRNVAPEQWDKQSPCPEWTARDASLHATGVLRWIEACARGGAPVEAKGNPGEEFVAARDGVLEALDHEHVLQKKVPTPFGELSIDDLIGIVFIDATTHTWDIARAVGGDERLDPSLVAAAQARALTMDPNVIRSAGFFGQPIPDAPGDDAQSKFLKFLGRQP